MAAGGRSGVGPVPPPGAQPLRLNRYLALCGVAARREALALVRAGRVAVNGTVCDDPGRQVQPDRDEVTVDGERVHGPRRWLYYAFHKPRGVVVTEDDELGRSGLTPYLRKLPGRVFAVGRLDRASEGLLLLTNHGALAHALLHPRQQVEKVYRVRVVPRPRPGQLARLTEGVALGSGEWSRPARVHLKRAGRGGGVLSIVLREGKKREVRRMCRAVGLRVQRLRRISFAGIRLEELPAGQIRPLVEAEIEQLHETAGVAR